MSGINWLAVAAAVIGVTALGAFWYSPAFLGTRWMKTINLNPEDISKQAAIKGMIISIGTAVISIVTMAVLMKLFALNTGLEGLLFGLAVGTGLVGATQLSNMAYEQEKIFELFLISGGYRIVSFLFIGWLLGFWQGEI